MAGFCDFAIGVMPDCYIMNVSGLSGGICLDCDSVLNGTWILNQTEDPCVYETPTFDFCGINGGGQIFFRFEDGFIELEFYLAGTGTIALYEDDGTFVGFTPQTVFLDSSIRCGGWAQSQLLTPCGYQPPTSNSCVYTVRWTSNWPGITFS